MDTSSSEEQPIPSPASLQKKYEELAIYSADNKSSNNDINDNSEGQSPSPSGGESESHQYNHHGSDEIEDSRSTEHEHEHEFQHSMHLNKQHETLALDADDHDLDEILADTQNIKSSAAARPSLPRNYFESSRQRKAECRDENEYHHHYSSEYNYHPSATASYHRRPPSADICDRLYVHAQELTKKRAMQVKQKMDDENQVESPKLKLVSTRSYTPQRARPSPESVHDHLYSLSKKRLEEEKRTREEREAAASIPDRNRLLISKTKSQEIGGRLYQKALKQKEEGRQRRESIEQKLAPRAPTPSRKIAAAKGAAIYERGMMYKANTNKKIEESLNSPRESSFPKMRTQRSRSTNRARSTSRNHRDRSATPNRRRNAEEASSSSSSKGTYYSSTPTKNRTERGAGIGASGKRSGSVRRGRKAALPPV